MKIKLFSNADSVKLNSFVTPWSYIHLLTGGMLYLYLKYIFKNISIIKSFIIIIIIHTIYEIIDLLYYFEITDSSTKIFNIHCGDNSLVNSIGDTLFAIIGFFIAIQIKEINTYFLAFLTFIYLITIFIFKKYIELN